jgi:hypothetical protein
MTATNSEESRVPKESRVPRGRPRIHNFETKQEYFRNYYSKNRHRWNKDHLCTTCELYCSFVNKARHARSKFHLKKMAEKGILKEETPNSDTPNSDTPNSDSPHIVNNLLQEIN